MEKNTVRSLTQIVVIGGSAGSLDVILHLFPQLQSPLPFAIVIVLHRQFSQPGILEQLFASKTAIPVHEIEDKDSILANNIYVAPADYHLLVEKDKTFSLDLSEKINFSRPSIDVTFETAGETYGSSLVCILLSGANSDGVEGLKAVHEMGGLVAVQDPDSALASYMPQQAINGMKVDRILKKEAIATFINHLD